MLCRSVVFLRLAASWAPSKCLSLRTMLRARGRLPQIVRRFADLEIKVANMGAFR